MKNLTSRLSQLTNVFNEILGRAGGVGMSIGVLHYGQILSTYHYGQCSLVDDRLPDGDTQYYIASLTKAITAMGTAILVEKGSLDWERPLVEYLPELASRNDDVGTQSNLIDVLSHRTGLTGANALWVQRKQEFMMPKEQTVSTTTYLQAIHGFRSKFQYNNWGYGLATEVIERVTGQTYGSFVKESIFDPLGLENTTIGQPNQHKVVGSHMVRSDGSPCLIRPPPNSDETGLAGAGGGKATLNDLLKLYACVLSRNEHEIHDHDAETHGQCSSLPKLQFLLEGKIGIGSADISKNSYALGWVRSVLPERLGTIGVNTMFLGQEKMPVIGTSTPGTVVLHHHGNLVGAISSVHLVPATNTAIVVLCNTFGLADSADWIGQLILQTILGEEPHDFVKLTEEAKHAGLQQFEQVKSVLSRGKTSQLPSLALEAYCGSYFNTIQNFEIEIYPAPDGMSLCMKVQHKDDVIYKLLNYDGDTFYWRCDRDYELCVEMMFPWPWSGLHRITFVVDAGVVKSLLWQHDPLTLPEEFRRGNVCPAPSLRGSLQEVIHGAPILLTLRKRSDLVKLTQLLSCCKHQLCADRQELSAGQLPGPHVTVNWLNVSKRAKMRVAARVMTDSTYRTCMSAASGKETITGCGIALAGCGCGWSEQVCVDAAVWILLVDFPQTSGEAVFPG